LERQAAGFERKHPHRLLIHPGGCGVVRHALRREGKNAAFRVDDAAGAAGDVSDLLEAVFTPRETPSRAPR
jgi:hypothetical protein